MWIDRPSRQGASLRVLACLIALGPAGPARAQAEAEAPREAEAEPATAPAPPRQPPDWYVALLGGPTWYSGSEVTATDKGILRPDVVVNQPVAWRPDAVVGLRLGAWVGPHLGFAMELGEISAKAVDVNVRVTTLSLLPMVRLPLVRSAGEPEGLLRLHLGFSLTAAVEGHGQASLAGLSNPVSGSAGASGSTGGSPSLGVGALVGLSLQLGPVVLFAEQRYATLGLTFTDYFQEIQTTLVSRQTVLGVALRLGKPAAPNP